MPKDPKARGVLKVLTGTWEQKAKQVLTELLEDQVLLERLVLMVKMDLTVRLVPLELLEL